MPEPAVAPGPRYLALDHGRRRIGVAVADAETRIAFARPALRTRSEAAAIERAASLARAEGAARVIVGLPLQADGREGDQARSARAFGERLAAAGLDVVFHDERLSTWQATGDLRAAERAASRRSGDLDSAAARVILQDYLDSKEIR